MADLTSAGLAQWIIRFRRSLHQAAEAARLALADSLVKQAGDNYGPVKPVKAKPALTLREAGEPLIKSSPLFEARPLLTSTELPETRTLLDKGQPAPRRGVWHPTAGQVRAAMQAAAHAFSQSMKQS